MVVAGAETLRHRRTVRNPMIRDCRPIPRLTRVKQGPYATFSQLACWPRRRHSMMPVHLG